MLNYILPTTHCVQFIEKERFIYFIAFLECHRQYIWIRVLSFPLVLMQDGWTGPQKSPIIAHTVSTGTKTFFLRAVNTGTETKDAEYCHKLFEEEIIKVENVFEAEVIGGVTDNCNTMERTRRILQIGRASCRERV